MRAICVLFIGFLLVIGTSGCSRTRAVASSAFTADATAIGPVPGPSNLPPKQPNPLAGDSVSLQDGRRLFDWYNCSGCHGGHAGGGMGPSLRDATWLYGNADEQVYSSIAQGRGNGMPSWGGKIPEHQIWELVTYIKAMNTPQEPDPPTIPADEAVPDPDTHSPPSQPDYTR